MSFDNGIETGRAEAGSRVRGGSEAARKRMMNRDSQHKRQVERDRAAREWKRQEEAEARERKRLNDWARSTRLYKDFDDYEKHRREGRQGYAD